jgi:hypothetical protein
MGRAILALIITWSLFTTAAFAKNDCLSCHGEKGRPGYINRESYEQSVHAFFSCTRCHLNISGYPHGTAVKVNCGICHLLGTEGAPEEQARQYKLSVHGRAANAGNPAAPTCQTCHGSHYIYPSADSRSATHREKIPALCSSCHPKEFAEYRTSIHGKEFLGRNNMAAADCFDCHLEHRTPNPEQDQFKLALIRECGTCHREELDTYRKTYHGKIAKLGYANVAKCSDCHGSHDILPPSDEDSKLSKKNIVATCKACHPGATAGFTRYYAHAEEDNRKKYPVLYYTYLFMTVLLIGVFTFFFTHTFLWAFRALKERLGKKGGS